MSKGSVLVKEAMKAKPVTIHPKTTVNEVASLMKKKGIGNLIVVDEKPVGIITESDILKKNPNFTLLPSKGQSQNRRNTFLLSGLQSE